MVEVPYVIDNPKSDSHPAVIAPTKNAAPMRAYCTPNVELIRSGFDPVMSLIIAWDAIKNRPTHSIPTNFAVQIVTTEGWIDTAPFARAIANRVKTKAGFRPIESSMEPNADDIIISVSPALADKIDKVDVARSIPISAMRAGAGENPTRATERMIKKEEDWKTARVDVVWLFDGVSFEGLVTSFVFGGDDIADPPLIEIKDCNDDGGIPT